MEYETLLKIKTQDKVQDFVWNYMFNNINDNEELEEFFEDHYNYTKILGTEYSVEEFYKMFEREVKSTYQRYLTYKSFFKKSNDTTITLDTEEGKKAICEKLLDTTIQEIKDLIIEYENENYEEDGEALYDRWKEEQDEKLYWRLKENDLI